MAQDFVLSMGLVEDAIAKRVTVSSFLNQLDPETDHKDGLDGFQRQLMKHNIAINHAPSEGIFASKFEDFMRIPGGHILAYELLDRQRRAYQERMFNMASAINAPNSQVIVPPHLVSTLVYPEIEPSALSYLIAMTDYVSAPVVSFPKITTAEEDKLNTRRVSEGAALPKVSATPTDEVVRLSKHGFELELTYEQLRNLSIPIVQDYMRIALENDARALENTAIDVLVNGDGTTGSAATTASGSTYDSGSVLTLKMDMLWRTSKWTSPASCDVVVGRNSGIVDQLLLSAGTANFGQSNYNEPVIGAAVTRSLVRTTLSGLKLIINSTVAANALLGVDSKRCLVYMIEQGSVIAEASRYVNVQKEGYTYSINDGFRMIQNGMNQILNYTV